MYCFKCGKKLPARVVNCPDCDTPQKRRQRYRRRMILGLFIFLAGAVAGSLFDTVFFKGQAWNHSFLGFFSSPEEVSTEQSLVPEENAGTAASVVQPPESASDSEVPAVTALATDSSQVVIPTDVQLDAPRTEVVASAPIQQSDAVAQPVEVVGSETAIPEKMLPVAPEPPAKPLGKLVYKKTEVLEKTSASDYHGFMARDGSELIFSSNRLKVNGTPTYQCFVRAVTPKAASQKLFDWPGNVWTPETTPDNNMVVFSSDSAKPEHIFVYDRKTLNSMPLTNGTSKNMMPSVSPDGRLVAFVSNRKGSNNIWLIGIDGSNLMQITTGNADDREPRWTPDGNSIIFTRILEPLKRSHIMQVMLEPLGEPVALVNTAARNWLADISPDGSLLAFTRSESGDGSKNVLVLREMSSGKEEVLRPLAGAECFRPVWNRDASGFVFHASARDGRSLYQAVFARESY